jgi:curved DNA-binding protein
MGPMPKSAKPSHLSPAHALAILRVSEDATPQAIKAAFRTEVKAARPDREGGDAERFRLVIEAYRLLQAQNLTRAPRPERPKPEPELEISIDEAFEGVARMAEIKGAGRVGVRLPAGMRTGDLVSLPIQGRAKPLERRIRIVSEPGRAVVGDDLWLTVPVDPFIIEDGGRVEVDTPYGARTVWAPRGLPKGAMVRVKDCGLPAHDGHRQGHAFLKLSPDPALAEGGARDLLDRFASAWTPDAPVAQHG